MAGLAERVLSLFDQRAAVVDPIHPGDPALAALFSFGRDSASGVKVTADSSLQLSAVYACVRVLSQSIAMLPLLLHERLPDGGKRRAVEHPLFDVLHRSPNPDMTSFEMRERQVAHILLHGNAYSEIETDGAGRTIRIWPLPPTAVDPIRTANNELAYRVRLADGGTIGLPASSVMHVRGYTKNGRVGVGVIEMAREAVGLGLALQEYAARFYANNTMPSGVLQHPKTLSETAQKNLRASLEIQHGGLENAQRTMLLQEGMTWQSISVPPGHAQFIESRQFTPTEIARFFGVQPHKIADLSQATFSNIEQQSIEFVTDTLMPWLVRFEQRYEQDLLLDAERDQLDIEHKVEGLLRGDSISRSQFYREMWGIGTLSVNDIRELESLNPVEGGDQRFVPLNMVPLEEAGSFGAGPPPPEDDARNRPVPVERRILRAANTRRRIAQSFESTFARRAQRILSVEVKALRRGVKEHLGTRDVQSYSDFLDEYYARDGKFRATAYREIIPAFTSFSEALAPEVLEEMGSPDTGVDMATISATLAGAFVARYVGSSQRQLGNVIERFDGIESDEMASALEGRLSKWEAERPALVAARETIQSNGALAKAVFKDRGVTRLRWVAFGENCPFCTRMNGKIVGIEENFVGAGTTFEADGRDPLKITTDISHPPIHKGCDCTIIAA